MIVELVILGALAWLAFYVIVILGVAALRGHVTPAAYTPSVEYADEFASKLSGSARERGPQASATETDPDIVFATATPQRRQTGLAAAHPTLTRKEIRASSEALGFHSTRAAASHLYLVK